MFTTIPVEDLTVENLNVGYFNRAVLYNSFNLIIALKFALDEFYDTMKQHPAVKQLTCEISNKKMVGFKQEIYQRLLAIICRTIYDSWDEFNDRLTQELVYNKYSSISKLLNLDTPHQQSYRENSAVLVDLLQKLVMNVIIRIQQTPELGPEEAIDISSLNEFRSNVDINTNAIIVRKGIKNYLLFDYYTKDFEKCLAGGDKSRCITTRLLKGRFTSWENMQTILGLNDVEVRNIKFAIANFLKVSALALQRLNDILMCKYYYLSQILLQRVVSNEINVAQFFYIFELYDHSESFSSWNDVMTAIQNVNIKNYDTQFLDLYPTLKTKRPKFSAQSQVSAFFLLQSFVFDETCDVTPTVSLENMPNADTIDISLLDAISTLYTTAEITFSPQAISIGFQKMLLAKEYKSWDEVAKTLKINNEQLKELKYTLYNVYEDYYYYEENSISNSKSKTVEKLQTIIVYKPQLLEPILTNEQVKSLILTDYKNWGDIENILSMKRDSLTMVKLRKIVAETQILQIDDKLQAEINNNPDLKKSMQRFPVEWDFNTIKSIHDIPLPTIIDYKYYALWLANKKPGFVPLEQLKWWQRSKNMTAFQRWKVDSAGGWFSTPSYQTDTENVKGTGISGIKSILSDENLSDSKKYYDTLHKQWEHIQEPKLDFDDFMILNRDLNVVDRGDLPWFSRVFARNYPVETERMKLSSGKLWYEWVAKGKPMLDIEARNYLSTIRMDENGYPYSHLASSLSDSKINKKYNEAFNKWTATIPRNKKFITEKQHVLDYVYKPLKTIYDSIPKHLVKSQNTINKWISFLEEFFSLANKYSQVVSTMTETEEDKFELLKEDLENWYKNIPRTERPPVFSYQDQTGFLNFFAEPSKDQSVLNPKREKSNEPDWIETLQILLNVFVIQYKRYKSWVSARLLYVESPGSSGSTNETFDAYNDKLRYAEIVRWQWDQENIRIQQEYVNNKSRFNIFSSAPSLLNEEDYYRNNVNAVRTKYEGIDAELLDTWQNDTNPNKPAFMIWRRERLISSKFDPKNPFLTETVDAVKYLEEVINKDRLPKIEQQKRVTPFAIANKKKATDVLQTIADQKLRCLGLTSTA